MKTRLLTTLAALLLALTSWANGVEIDGIHYVLDSSTMTASVTYTSSTSNNPNPPSTAYTGNITIPASVTYDGTTYTVAKIGDYAFRYCTGLTSISIPSSVTSIEDYAFHYCTGLTSISIPSSVTSIGDDAFHYCTGLTSITIPSSVTSIGDYAFSICSGLASIKVEAGNTAYDSRENCNALIETASNTLIAGCMNTTIPNSVTKIGDYAFYCCTGLTSIDIPSSVTSIGYQAFYGCTGLKSIKVEAGNTAYDSRENCNAIIETASNTLVAGCMNTTIPNSVTTIGDQAFYGCTGLKSISIPASVTSIEDFAFKNCTGLTSINLPASVATIGDYAFSGCSGLTSISIPSSVTSIRGSAFEDCTGLASISIPSSVTSIGWYAFDGCSGLTDIYALRTDPAAYNCATDAFSDYSYSATLYVPSGSKEAYASTSPWSNFANIEEEPVQVGGLRYTIQGDAATCVGTGSVEGWFNEPVLNIPERITYDGKEYSVTAVDGGGGYGSIIVLPKTLKRIGRLSAQSKTIICLSPTPPEIESISLNNCALYVPDEYLEAHRAGWVIDGKLFGLYGFDVESYPNLLESYIRPMSHLLNYVYDDETMTATINGFRLLHSTSVRTDALGCTSSRMSENFRERIWAEQNDINLDWVVPATITKFEYLLYGSRHSRLRTGETYAVKKVEKLLGARSVTLSEGIEEVGPNAFALTLWPMVTDAEGNAQYYNDPLESVSLPSTLKLLDIGAFLGCTSLKHVEMKEGLDSIGLSVFTYCLSLEDCHLPASLRAMGYGHGNLNSLQAFSTAQGSEYIVAKDGVLFSDGGKTLLQYPAGKPDTTYEVPEGTVKLSAWSFEAVQELESIILPASVEEIGTWIFANTHCLKHIYCKSQTPPDKIGGWWLKASAPIRPDDAALSAYDIYKEVTVHVPFGCKEIYAIAPAWKDFNIVEDINTGIEPLGLTPTEADAASYYNLQGQRIARPQRGQIVIQRNADGTGRKVVVQ